LAASTVLVENWVGITGAVATILGGVSALVGWLMRLQRRYMTRIELKEELKELEGRLQKRIDDLDRHVETMTAMWVAKGP
jgi:CHASE1-domain containing sensor protein